MSAKINLQHVEAVFHRIVELPPAYRSEALGQVTDPELRAQVAELLRADGEVDGFLDQVVSGDKTEPVTEGIPERIGPYIEDGVLGRGGLDEVYGARDLRLDRAVAIKTVSRHLSKDPSAIKRLRREAKSLAAFSHPNIAAIHGIEEDGDRFYLVLERVEGISLAQRLASGPLPWKEALALLVQLAQALEAAHERDLVHRDIKPSNMIITDDQRVKLLDFGLAKPLKFWTTQSEAEPLTAPNALVGTCAYMSPEQLKGGEVHAAGDVWAFGCVIYECLSGRRAFPGQTPIETMDRVLNEEPEISLLPHTVPAALLRLVQRCLRKDPSDRLRHIGDARLELAQLLAEASGGSGSSWARRRGASLHYWRRRFSWSRWLPAVGFGLLIGLGLAGSVDWVADRQAGQLSEPESVIRFGFDIPELNISDYPNLAISPDGSRIAMTGAGKLWIRRLSKIDVKELEGVGGKLPFFSPDGSSLGFYGQRSLQRVDPGGGIAVPIVPDVFKAAGASWGSRGDLVYVPRWTSPILRWTTAGVGTPVTELNLERGEISHRWPHFLPDGDGMVFVIKSRDTATFDDAELAVTRLSTGGHRLLSEIGTSPAFLSTGHLLFCRHDSLIGVPFDSEALAVVGDPKVLVEGVHQDMVTGVCWYAVSETGTLVYLPSVEQPVVRLSEWHADGEGRELFSTLGLGDAILATPKLSPNGEEMVVTVVRANEQIWRYDFARGTVMPLTEGMGNTAFPIWSPSGDEIVFVQEKLSTFAIIRMKTDGSGQRREIFQDPKLRATTDWSSDGRYVIFDRTPSPGEKEIWVLDLDAAEDDPKRAGLLMTGDGSFESASLSFDGKWLAFKAVHQGQAETFVRAFPGPGSQIQVSIGGGASPTWSRNRLELYYIDMATRELTRVRFTDDDGLRMVSNEPIMDFSKAGSGFDHQDEKTVAAVANPRIMPAEQRLQVVVGWHHKVLEEFDS